MGLHYEMIIKLVKYCPMPLACGTNRVGKTTSARAGLSLIGNSTNFFVLVKERFMPRLCSHSTLPPVLDDIKVPNILESRLLPTFTVN